MLDRKRYAVLLLAGFAGGFALVAPLGEAEKEPTQVTQTLRPRAAARPEAALPNGSSLEPLDLREEVLGRPAVEPAVRPRF